MRSTIHQSVGRSGTNRTPCAYKWHTTRCPELRPAGAASVDAAQTTQLTEFVIPKERAEQLQRESGLATEDFLMSLVPSAARLARPPVSNFQVGAVGLGASGNIYLGVNIEFVGGPLSQSVHAEQCLMTNLLLHQERAVQLVAISEAPCGHCRQFFSELVCADTVQFVFGAARSRHHLDELLPRRFGPHDLLSASAFPLLMEPQHNAVALTAAGKQAVAARQDDELFQQAVELALQNAQQSYCPYTRLPSGVALATGSGAVYGGRYVESAAYNPSLPPLQSALAAAVIGGLPDYKQVQEVVLVERSRSAVQQRGIIKTMARHLFPDATITVLGISTAKE